MLGIHAQANRAERRTKHKIIAMIQNMAPVSINHAYDILEYSFDIDSISHAIKYGIEMGYIAANNGYLQDGTI